MLIVRRGEQSGCHQRRPNTRRHDSRDFVADNSSRHRAANVTDFVNDVEFDVDQHNDDDDRAAGCA